MSTQQSNHRTLRQRLTSFRRNVKDTCYLDLKEVHEKSWSIKNEHCAAGTEEEAKFIFEQADKYLKDTLETSKLVTDKSSTFLTLSVGLVAALVGFVVSEWEKNKVFDPVMWASVVGCGYLFFVSILFSVNIRPKAYCVPGARPELFFSDEGYKPLQGPTKRLYYFYLTEIEQYQYRIDVNNKTNAWRWRLFRISCRALVLTPVVFVVTFLIVK